MADEMWSWKQGVVSPVGDDLAEMVLKAETAQRV